MSLIALAAGLETGNEIAALANKLADNISESVIANLHKAGVHDACAEAELREYALRTATLTIMRRLYEKAIEKAEAIPS